MAPPNEGERKSKGREGKEAEGKHFNQCLDIQYEASNGDRDRGRDGVVGHRLRVHTWPTLDGWTQSR